MSNLRRLLLLADYDRLTEEEQVLFRSYRNRVERLIEYMEDPVRAEWNFAYEIFHNIAPTSFQDKQSWSFYRDLIDVTSYYQANKAGPEKFVNTLLSKLGPSEKLRIPLKLSQLPALLDVGDCTWVGTPQDDVTFDVGNAIDNSLVLLEFKMRIDSGCTAGRKEILEAKFLPTLQHLVHGKELYSLGNGRITLVELLRRSRIRSMEMYLSVLFDLRGEEATEESDKQFICYSAMVTSFQRIEDFLNQNKTGLKRLKPNKLGKEGFLSEFVTNGIAIRLGTKYGNAAVEELFKGKGSAISTLKETIGSLVYDDLWVAQLIAISERSILLQQSDLKNYLVVIKKIIETDFMLSQKVRQFTALRYSNEAKARDFLNEIINEIKTKAANDLAKLPKPIMVGLLGQYVKYDLNDYLADIFQMLSSIMK
jgi:hypothetical protein